MLEKWQGHQLVNLQKEVVGPIPKGILTAVSVAVAMEIDGRPRLVASLRADYPVWEFAGGKVDAGEDSRQAAVREIKEELNLTIHQVEHACSMLVLRKDKSYLMQFYVAKVAPGSDCISRSEREIAATEYINPDNDYLPADRMWWPATVEAWWDIQQTVAKMFAPEPRAKG